MLIFSREKPENDWLRNKVSGETISEVVDEELNMMSVTLKIVAMINITIDSFL